MKLLLSALGFLALLIFMACLEIPPHWEYEIPSVQGRVIDATTGAPITGARIAVVNVMYNKPGQSAVSDAHGRFMIEPVSYIHWIRMPLGDRIPPGKSARVEIDATGYVSYAGERSAQEPLVRDFKLARQVAGQ